jgi:hypothetical protein
VADPSPEPERSDVPSLEERVTTLEAPLTARDAHRKNIELLNALRVTQAEHSATLADHTSRLDAIDGKLGTLTVGMHTIETLLRRRVDEEGR